MQDYGFDPKTTSAKAAKVEQEFYKNLGLKKRFNVNDQILAEKTYADEYNLDPLNLTVQQKALAANDYKEKYGSFVEGSNVYSQFLYENYGIGEDLREVTEAIANDTVETKSWFKDAIKWASDFVGSSVIFETKQEFDRLSEDGFSVVDGLSLLSTFTTQSALKLLPDSIKDGITRGASSIVNAAGNTMTYLADKRQTKVNTLMTGIEEDVNKQEDFNRYIELKDKRNKGTLTEQEQKELTNIVDNYKSSELQLYKDTKDGVGDLYSKLNVLGKSLESLGDTIQSLEMLNNEYTKGIKSGEIEMSWKDYRFWTNQMPEVVGQMGALMGLTMLTPGVPDEYALAGYVIESIPINVMFSASEAQDVRRSSIEAGLSEEEADKKATETFRWNFGLQAVTGSAPGAFTKLASRTNVFSKVISSNWAKKAIAIGTDSFLEGFEEVAQQSIQNYQLSGEAQVLAKGNLEIFMLGAAGGLMGGGLQLANERSFNKTFDAVIEQAPIVQVMYEENIKEGMDEVEAKDKAMSDFSDAASSAMEKLTKVAVQEEVAEQLIKPIADAEQQKTKIQNAQKAEMNVEERNSQIGGANFKYDESNPNARVYDGIDMQSQYTDDYAINEYLMRKTVSRYPNIKYDPKTNSYRTEGKMTKFATEVNDKSNRYSGLNKLLQKLGTDVTTDNVKQYMKKNELKNNDIHNIYDAKAITTQQYVKALKSMKLKARDSQLAKNMDNGSKIEKMINKLDKLSAKEYRSFVDSLIKEHGTLEAGLKQLVEDGVINANDAAKFKNHENTIKQEEKDDTKKQLEAATKVVESQKEAATKNKETVKTLKDENKKLKTTLKTEQLPQEVNTVKEIQDDPKIGKSIEQKKIVEMKQKKNDKEIDQIFIKQTHKIEAPKIEPDGVIKTPTNEIKVGDVIRKQQSANGKIIDVDFKVISVEKNDNGAYLTLYSEKYDVTRKNMLYFEKDGTSKLTFDVVAKNTKIRQQYI